MLKILLRRPETKSRLQPKLPLLLLLLAFVTIGSFYTLTGDGDTEIPQASLFSNHSTSNCSAGETNCEYTTSRTRTNNSTAVAHNSSINDRHQNARKTNTDAYSSSSYSPRLNSSSGLEFGSIDSLIDVREGNMNVIITVPHGGSLTPPDFEVRKPGCYSRVRGCSFTTSCRFGTERSAEKCRIVKGMDNHTYEIALQLRSTIEKLTGRRPYFIGSLLARSRVDPNRQIDEATSMNRMAIAAYRRYHTAIDNATREIQTRFANGALIIDIHGHSHSHNFTELGYGIPLEVLNTGNYSPLKDGSLQFLARKYLNLSVDQNLIAGHLSLGAFFEDHGVKAVPSPRRKRPKGLSYFSGAFTVKTYGTVRRRTAAVQVEIPNFFRMTHARYRYTERLARALKNFILVHMPYY